ncbi:hypothetical protein PG989_011797 [Apiospora arundinis]
MLYPRFRLVFISKEDNKQEPDVQQEPHIQSPRVRLYYTVCFANGSDEERELVKSTVEKHYHAIDMSVRFKFLEARDWNGPGAICITFENSDSSWCRLGLLPPRNDPENPTMCLSLQGLGRDEKQQVVLHEFGHALGLHHQHQHPDSGIKWNEEKLKRMNPDISSRAIHKNYIDTIRSLAHVPYDRDYIMHYSVSLHMATNLTEPIRSQKVLSEGDKKLLMSMYPPIPCTPENSDVGQGAVVELKVQYPIRQEGEVNDHEVMSNM